MHKSSVFISNDCECSQKHCNNSTNPKEKSPTFDPGIQEKYTLNTENKIP